MIILKRRSSITMFAPGAWQTCLGKKQLTVGWRLVACVQGGGKVAAHAACTNSKEVKKYKVHRVVLGTFLI